MKAAFITSVIYPSPTANRIHILSMAKAFAKKNVLVDLLCQRISNTDLSPMITKVEIGTNKSLTSAWKYASYLKKHDCNFWFIREPHLMFLTIIFFILKSQKLPPHIIYEVHDLPRDYFDGLSLRLLKLLNNYRIITITKFSKEDLGNEYSIPEAKIDVLPDGVDMELFSQDRLEKNPFVNERESGKPLVVYAGSLFRWKGVFTLLEAAKLMPNINFWIIGGHKKDVEDITEVAAELHNVKIWGHIPHERIYHFLDLADVLVLPNSSTYRMSERYTSPLKLFEYMASCKPIVASNLPSIREILEDGVNGYLVEADDSVALKRGIERALSDDNKSIVIQNAQKDVSQYTWDARVDKILNRVTNNL